MRKAIFGLSVVGIAVSALMLQAHYSAWTGASGSQAGWDCGLVNHSGFSAIGPIPVAVIGVVGYLVLALLSWFRKRGWTLLFGWIGLGFAAYLSYVEAYALGVWCSWCVVSQCLIAAIAVLAAVDVGIAITRKLSGASNVVDEVVSHLRYG